MVGKIVVHDRVTVESSILPRYFNHSSFASLRRQLNYFKFTRIGKGRQRGATYCNEGVVELTDILTLKRRSVANHNGGGAGSSGVVVPATNNNSSSATPVSKTGQVKNGNKGAGDRRSSSTKKRKSMVMTNSSKKNTIKRHRISISGEVNQTPIGFVEKTRLLPPRVSPVDHLVGGDDGPPMKRISLDLTRTSSPEVRKPFRPADSGLPSTIYADFSSMRSSRASGFEDDDILAGCKALLCISRGTSVR